MDKNAIAKYGILTIYRRFQGSGSVLKRFSSLKEPFFYLMSLKTEYYELLGTLMLMTNVGDIIFLVRSLTFFHRQRKLQYA